MKGSFTLFSISLCLFGVGALKSVAGPQGALKVTYADVAQPVVKKYCVSCHSGASPAAGVDFSKFHTDASITQSPDVWTQAARYLASKHMPPAGSPQPSDALRVRLVAYIQKTLNSPCGLNDPGRVTIHRLNRVEYANTVHDLLGINFAGTEDFPSDDVGYGFDNIGDVLSMSPLLMEKYLNAAEQIAGEAIVEREGPTAEFGLNAIQFNAKYANFRGDDLEFFTNGIAKVTVDLKMDGHYVLKVRAYGDQAGPDPCQMVVTVDQKQIASVWVKEKNRLQAADFEFPVSIFAGKHQIGVGFTNDYYKPTDPDPHNRDRNLILERIYIQGPAVTDGDIPQTQRHLIPTEPAKGKEQEAARAFFSKLALRAYRRPVTTDEVAKLAKYVDLALKNGDSFETGIQVGIEAMLVSPNFLFRLETDPKPNDPAAKRLLTGYEVASRLSYFLWSSMPDDELFKLAADGSLQKPEVVTEQALRMLKDPKARALSENFAAQWLTLRKLAIVSPDKHLFPEFNDQLRHDMEHETKEFFASIVQNDGSVLDFLDGKYTFINERLADLYGIKGVSGDQFREVSLEGTQREGVLTQASVLTVTSNPTRTSPVKRGKWVLEEILGTPPPPAPPGVGVLKDEEAHADSQTLRQMMEVHRKNPTCAACHARMDPLGFGMENFDGVGKWREKDGKFAIDPSGKLPDGQKFAGPIGLIKVLSTQKDLFVRCLAEKMMTYALGRGLTASDQCVLDGIVKSTAAANYRFSALVKAIVSSDPFRKRRGDGGING